jgi:hypothetical protein
MFIAHVGLLAYYSGTLGVSKEAFTTERKRMLLETTKDVYTGTTATRIPTELHHG